MTAGAAEIQYAVVLTSCGRFNLLRQTVESFLRFADARPMQFIVVEDSGDEKVRDVLAEFDYPFEILIQPAAAGNLTLWQKCMRQMAAIDAGYSRVKTPLVFHCEDDWLFFRPGFIRESHVLLRKFPKIARVGLRGREENEFLRNLPYEQTEGVMFFRADPDIHPQACYCSYNPGLRRMSDYRMIAPVAEIGDEGDVNEVFKILGWGAAWLEIPAVVHLGWGRSAQVPVKISKTAGAAERLLWIAGGARRKMERLRKRLRRRAVRAKWRAYAAAKKKETT